MVILIVKHCFLTLLTEIGVKRKDEQKICDLARLVSKTVTGFQNSMCLKSLKALFTKFFTPGPTSESGNPLDDLLGLVDFHQSSSGSSNSQFNPGVKHLVNKDLKNS